MSAPRVGDKVKRVVGPQTWTGTVQHYRQVSGNPTTTTGDGCDYRVVVVADSEAPIPGALMKCRWSECEVVP